jgi:hypothetical protein
MDELVRNNLPYLAQKTIEGGRHIKSRPRYFWPQFYFGLGVHEKTRSQVWDVADSLDNSIPRWWTRKGMNSEDH